MTTADNTKLTQQSNLQGSLLRKLTAPRLSVAAVRFIKVGKTQSYSTLMARSNRWRHWAKTRLWRYGGYRRHCLGITLRYRQLVPMANSANYFVTPHYSSFHQLRTSPRVLIRLAVLSNRKSVNDNKITQPFSVNASLRPNGLSMARFHSGDLLYPPPKHTTSGVTPYTGSMKPLSYVDKVQFPQSPYRAQSVRFAAHLSDSVARISSFNRREIGLFHRVERYRHAASIMRLPKSAVQLAQQVSGPGGNQSTLNVASSAVPMDAISMTLVNKPAVQPQQQAWTAISGRLRRQLRREELPLHKDAQRRFVKKAQAVEARHEQVTDQFDAPAQQHNLQRQTRWQAPAPAINVDAVAEQVMQQINRRVSAWRERTGRV